MSSTWKHAEREIARRLHGERVGLTGRATADVVSDWLAVEVKHRRRLPQWIKSAIEQAEEAADETQLAIAVLHEKHQRYDRSIVLLRLEDFEDWFGN